MSERFGIPDHSPQHAPDHAPQNPTAQGSWGSDAGGSDWPSSATTSYGGGGGAIPAIPYNPRKNVTAAIILAMLFGPLGLFYVGFLNGLAALFIVVPVVRPIAFVVAFALFGRGEVLAVIIPLMWCVTVPWAIIGARRRNRKLDRLAGN